MIVAGTVLLKYPSMSYTKVPITLEPLYMSTARFLFPWINISIRGGVLAHHVAEEPPIVAPDSSSMLEPSSGGIHPSWFLFVRIPRLISHKLLALQLAGN